VKPPPNFKRDPLIVGLAGAAHSGKSTAARYLQERHAFEPYTFATPLKAMLEQMLIECGLDYAYVHEPQLKSRPIPGLGFSYRHLAQTLGTEWGRNQVHEDLWVRLAALCLGLPDAPIHDRIVIHDVRHPNEAEWIESLGGVVVRIFRRDAPAVRAHESEQLLDLITPWARIDNDLSIEHLHDQLDTMLASLDHE
jgi:hypothetical protein